MKHLFRILLLMLFFLKSTSALYSQSPPTVQDCLGAIPVCQNVYTTTQSYIGHGNVYPEIHNNSVCPLCMDGEINDVFYTFTVQTSGILRFTLTPNNLNNDYDWSLFNMTNATCAQLYPDAVQLQVSCNSYGVLGYNGPTGINSTLSNNRNCNGPGTTNGPAFNEDVNVLQGQTYLLNISNWSSTDQQGYTLDFSASTAQIFDNIPPYIDSIQQTISCAGSSTLFVRFSENVLCSDIENMPGVFTITSAGGTYTVTGLTSPDCDIGAHQTTYCILQVSPPLFGGNYNLNIVGPIGDLCNNLAVYQSYPFHLTEVGAPVVSAGNDTTVNNGAIITLHGSAVGGTPPLGWQWEPANLLVNPNLQDPLTVNMGASTTFSVVVNDSIGCHGNSSVIITVVGGPLGVNAAASPDTICEGGSSQLTAIPTGGSGNYTYSWSSDPPGFTSNIPNPLVYPVVTTTYTVQLFDGFSTIIGEKTVTVHPKPTASAGNNVSIPYGTTTTLHGYATGGSGVYTYQWSSSPSGFFSNLPEPITQNLDVTTLFTLVVTDVTTGCISDPSQVIVTVTGFALNITPTAAKPAICFGNTTRLYAMAGGGSGNYTFSWTSYPPGFSSTDENPVVTPLSTTTYYLYVNDGYNSDTGSVIVHVNPVPFVHIGPPDTTVCIFSSVLLDAHNPGATYYWSNGSTDRTILVSTAGITYDYQTYSVQVTNSYGCTDSTSINITFSFSACLGVREQAGEADWKIYPNPASGEVYLEIPYPDRSFTIQLIDELGRVLEQQDFTSSAGDTFHGSIRVDKLPAGFYFVRLNGNTGWRIKNVIIR